MHYLNPMIFKKRRFSRAIPRDLYSACLKVALSIELGIRESDIKGILFWRKGTGGISATRFVRIIRAAKVLLPFFIPITHVIWYKGIARIRWLSNPKVGSRSAFIGWSRGSGARETYKKRRAGNQDQHNNHSQQDAQNGYQIFFHPVILPN
jgi:hypothetical protein